jgi:hypothetical protein
VPLEEGDLLHLAGPGVGHQPADPAQPQPLRGVPQQPAADSAPAVALVDSEVADVGEAALNRVPLGLVEHVDLDVRDGRPVEVRGEAGAVDADEPADPQPGQRRVAGNGQLGQVDQPDRLGL